MNSQQERFFDDLIIFLRTQQNLFEYDFLQIESINLYKLVFDTSQSGESKTPSFSISFWKDKDNLTLFSLELNVFDFKEMEVKIEKKNFWGKVYFESILEKELIRYSCHPFVLDYSQECFGFEPYPELYSYVNLEEILKLSKLFDKSKELIISNIANYLKDSFAHHEKCINKNEDAIENELVELNIEEVFMYSDGMDEDLKKMLSKFQKEVVNIDYNHIHNFIKLSNFIKTKKKNIQSIYNNVQNSELTLDRIEFLHILKNQIHSYNLTIFHSLSMVTSLIDGDMITFYEIYESFDKLNVFNSNWENEVLEKLDNIEDGLNDLMQAIYQMEINIVNEISNLSYVTQEGFIQLNNSVSEKLLSIDSSVKFNNLLSSIQTYQMYRLNKN
jgi:hypothetical protein